MIIKNYVMFEDGEAEFDFVVEGAEVYLLIEVAIRTMIEYSVISIDRDADETHVDMLNLSKGVTLQ